MRHVRVCIGSVGKGFPERQEWRLASVQQFTPIEDLLQIDLSGRKESETHWLPDLAERFLKQRWEEEKEIFHSTPRRPMWKEKEWDKAKRMQRGALKMLLEFVGAEGVTPLKTTVAIWRKLLARVIAVEGELRTSDNRLMGRLDMLFADVDDSGELQGWIVADLKTGRAPESELKPEVERQLLLYSTFFYPIIPMRLR